MTIGSAGSPGVLWSESPLAADCGPQVDTCAPPGISPLAGRARVDTCGPEQMALFHLVRLARQVPTEQPARCESQIIIFLREVTFAGSASGERERGGGGAEVICFVRARSNRDNNNNNHI